MEHFLGLDVGDLPELLHEFRDIDEAGKPGVEAVAGAVRGEFHRGDRFAEGRRPGVEMVQVEGPERGHLEIALHGEHLRHAVGDRGTGREHHTASPIYLLDVPGLEEQIEGPLRGCLRQARDSGHLADVKEILEVLGFINEQPIHAQFLEGQRVVLLPLGQQELQPRFQSLLRTLQVFDNPPIVLARALLTDGHFQIVELLAEECLLGFIR